MSFRESVVAVWSKWSKRMTQTNYFTEENLKPEPREELSPSGRTKLLIRRYSTKKGCWNYSRGTLYRVSDGELIADIKRNYASFTHSWVEKDGQEYLIGGRSYMNQCIINCDEGREVEVSDKDLEKAGSGFCWVDAMLSPDGNTLIVDGCYWACSYEFKFFDFTDPSRGWPEIPIVDKEEYEKHKDSDDAKRTYVCSDETPPKFNDDGTFTVYETTSVYLPTSQREDDISMEQLKEYGEAYDDESNWAREVDTRRMLRRHGNVLVTEDV